MKQRLYLLIVAAVLAVGIVSVVLCGCTAPQQRVTYNTLYSTHVAVDRAFAGYMAAVLMGKASTNNVPKAAKAYDTFQLSFNTALELAMFNTNAVTPPAVVSNAMNVFKLTERAQ